MRIIVKYYYQLYFGKTRLIKLKIMKVAIIGHYNIGKTTLNLLNDKCDLPIVISSFVEKETFTIKNLRVDDLEEIKVSENILNKGLNKNYGKRYRKNNNYGSKYHK
jgi:hypothetical protein